MGKTLVGIVTFVELKRCSICKKDLPLDNFFKKKDGKYGVGSWCKKCHNFRNKINRNKKLELYRQYWKNWFKNNTDKERNRTRERAREIRKLVIKSYGGKCNCCGEERIEFLCIDHINGKNKISLKDVGIVLYQRLKKENFPPGFRVLCHNCNMSLGFYGYCPHGGLNV